jgi:hypothetical protein
MSLTKATYSMIDGAVINVKDYGAIGDGSTDDTNAILAAINAAVSFGANTPKAIYFPRGNYVITQTNVFGQWNSIDTANFRGVRGLTLFGDNKYTSIITVKNTGATDFYFYDNYDGVSTAANNSLQWPRFRDLGFVGDKQSTGKINGFREWGVPNGYPSQNFNFDNCWVYRINDFLILGGSVNASENTFINCAAQEVDRFIYSINSQAVNHTLLNCNIENYFTTVFDFEKGGQLNVIGGSYIANAGAPSLFLHVHPPSGIGVGSQFNFRGVKTEMHDPGNKLINLSGIDNDAAVTFNTCSFYTRTGLSSADAISVGAASNVRLNFSYCDFSGNDGLTWINNGSPNYWVSPENYSIVVFEYCVRFSKININWQSNTIGYTRIFSTSGVDFEGGAYGTFPGNDTAIKNVAPKFALGYGQIWPNSNGNVLTCVLPLKSTIKAIYVRKGANSSSSSTYQLQVVDGAGTPIVVPTWATGTNVSTSAARLVEHNIFIQNLMKYVSDTTTATITVTTTAGNAGDAVYQEFHTYSENDIFVVEYF